MNNILMIVKKELDKIFKFPRVFFATIILPGFIIFSIYALMGTQLSSELNKEYKYRINIFNSTEEFNQILDKYSQFIDVIPAYEEITLDQLKLDLVSQNIDLVVVFSENFEDTLFTDASNISLYANNGSANSMGALNIINEVLNEYKQYILEKNNIVTDVFKVEIDDKYTDENKNVGTILAMLLPMLMITFVFAGTLSVGADAIAGEKERGTLATLLMAPIKRNDIIIGKIISTAIISILSAASSIIGIFLSLPFAKDLFQINASVTYHFADYLQLFVIVILLGMLSSSLILAASTFARTTKEATSYAMPIYIIAILIPTFSMFSTGESANLVGYAVPIYNISLSLKDIFAYNTDIVKFIITLSSNIIYITLLVFVLLKMFKNEKILFSK